MIRWIKSRLTMSRIQTLFVDKVVGKTVYKWIDCYGTKWMAFSKWGYRVKTVNQN